MARVDNMPKFLSGEMSSLEYIHSLTESKYNYMMEKRPDDAWTLEIQLTHWNQIKEAQKSGKKLIFYAGPLPSDIIHAFDCEIYNVDQLSVAAAANSPMAHRFIDETEKYAPQSMCAINKVQLGAMLADSFGVKPDAYIYSTIPCDSARIAFPNMDKMLGVPTFVIDTPFRRDERGRAYLAKQVRELVVFLEELTGTKLDWDRYKEIMKVANQTGEMLEKLADLRKKAPCPLPSVLLISNSYNSGMAHDTAFLAFLEKQYELGQFMVEFGMGACVGGERYRISLLQNLVWGSMEIYSRLERELGATIVMDVMGHFKAYPYNNMDDIEDCYRVMADKMQGVPMIHGASGPVENYFERISWIYDEYNINASIFVGHVGCKHTWASNKIMSEFIQSKYGMPTLSIDADCIDNRYKSGDEIFNEIKEYLETVVSI